MFCLNLDLHQHGCLRVICIDRALFFTYVGMSRVWSMGYGLCVVRASIKPNYFDDKGTRRSMARFRSGTTSRSRSRFDPGLIHFEGLACSIQRVSPIVDS